MQRDLSVAAHRIKTPRRWLAFQIVAIFFLPIAIIKLGIVPIRFHVLFLSAVALILVGILIRERWTLSMLGITRALHKDAVYAYAIFTTIALIIISQTGELVGKEELSHWWHHSHFLYIFLIVSVLQEIAYRGYLMPALTVLSDSPAVVMFCNALFFTLLHVIFPSFLYNLPLAFIGGLGFAYMYLRYPNLALIIISHAILNFVAVLYGFFIVPGITY